MRIFLYSLVEGNDEKQDLQFLSESVEFWTACGGHILSEESGNLMQALYEDPPIVNGYVHLGAPSSPDNNACNGHDEVPEREVYRV